MLGVFVKLPFPAKIPPFSNSADRILWELRTPREFFCFNTMSSTPLPNYLRSNRKRSGLSQDEVAFLLGAQSGAKVCRNERFVREPSLATALAYQAIFQRPASELFGGLYEEI